MKPDSQTNLETLFNPKSVAIIGASEKSYEGVSLYRGLKKGGFAGNIYPVNHKRDELFGVKCYRNVLDIPEDVDVAAIAVPRRAVLSVVGDCIEKGVRGAVLITAGFAEADNSGRELQSELVTLANEGGMRLIGPNCMGYLNVNNGIFLTSGAIADSLQKGSVGLVSQSGSMFWGIASNRRRLGFSYLISAGNSADLNCWDYVDFLIEDPGTKIITLFLESIQPADRFLEVARRARLARKPIVVLRVGTSERGREAALSHTGSLAGSEVVVEAAFKQYGIIRVQDLDELLETAKLLSHFAPHAPGRYHVAFATLSGGEAAHLADLATEVGLPLASFSKSTVSQLSSRLPSWRTVRNPLDVGGAGLGNVEVIGQVLDVLLQDEGVDVVFVCRSMPPSRPSRLTEGLLRAVQNVADASEKWCALFTPVSGEVDSEVVRDFEKTAPLLQGTTESLRAIGHWLNYCKFLQIPETSKQAEEVTPSVDSVNVGSLPETPNGILNEKEAKDLLSHYGVCTTHDRIASSHSDALVAAHDIGYPVVAKVLSKEIAHKSDLGLVQLNINSDAELKLAYEELLGRAKAHVPESALEGVLIQEMVSGGREMIVGLKWDENFGQTVLLGFGGVFTEIIGEFSVRLAPLTRADAREMVAGLKGYELLKGARGGAVLDIEALEVTLLQLSKLGISMGAKLRTLDINPLIVLPKGQGTVAVDALAVIAK